MRLFSYLSVAVLLVSGVVLTAYSPDLLSMVIVGFMCMITLAGCIYGLLPTISFTGGLLNGQNSIRKASGTEGSSAWVAALRIERFFQQKRLDKLFGEYREKVQHQRETGQIVSDIDEVLNEDVLALYTWRGVIAQIPGTLTGLGILGTFVGLLLGLRNISFVTVEAALGSVQSILAGIDTAFYTSIAGVILSILFNITNNVLRNIMNRETGLFLEEFHKTVIPTTDEQARYSSRREVRQILELLDQAREKKAIIYYDPNFRSSHKNEAMKLAPTIIENLEYADIVRGSLEDFFYMYGLQDVDKIYKDKIKFYCPRFICTAGGDKVSLRTNLVSKEYPIEPLEAVSTIGAGDNFNAGLIYGLLKYDVRYRDLNNLNEEVWDKVVQCGKDFAAEVCRSFSNSVSVEFAGQYASK